MKAMPSPDFCVTNDADARELLTSMLAPALRRQLWAFFLDAAGRTLPVLIPIDGIPASPPRSELETIVRGLGEVLDAHAVGGSILFALERPGAAPPHAFDELWAAGLFEAATQQSVELFGVYLLHSDGLRMLKARSSARR
jgi:hypothetical protein